MPFITFPEIVGVIGFQVGVTFFLLPLVLSGAASWRSNRRANRALAKALSGER